MTNQSIDVAPQPLQKTISLDTPVTRGKEKITTVTLRKPQFRFPDSLTVDDLVADIATIFHWPPSVTDIMPLTEVLEWRHKAILRSGAGDNE